MFQRLPEFPRSITASFFLGLVVATVSPAASPVAPALSLSDGTNTITIDSSGNAPVCSGSCSTSSYSAVAGSGQGDMDRGPRQLLTHLALPAQTKPVLSSALTIDLGIASLAGAGASGGTPTASFTDTGFTGSRACSHFLILGNCAGSFTAYADNSNAAFGQGITIGNSTGGFSTSNRGTVFESFFPAQCCCAQFSRGGASQNIDFGSFRHAGHDSWRDFRRNRHRLRRLLVPRQLSRSARTFTLYGDEYRRQRP